MIRYADVLPLDIIEYDDGFVFRLIRFLNLEKSKIKKSIRMGKKAAPLFNRRSDRRHALLCVFQVPMKNTIEIAVFAPCKYDARIWVFDHLLAVSMSIVYRKAKVPFRI